MGPIPDMKKVPWPALSNVSISRLPNSDCCHASGDTVMPGNVSRSNLSPRCLLACSDKFLASSPPAIIKPSWMTSVPVSQDHVPAQRRPNFAKARMVLGLFNASRSGLRPSRSRSCFPPGMYWRSLRIATTSRPATPTPDRRAAVQAACGSIWYFLPSGPTDSIPMYSRKAGPVSSWNDRVPIPATIPHPIATPPPRGTVTSSSGVSACGPSCPATAFKAETAAAAGSPILIPSAMDDKKPGAIRSPSIAASSRWLVAPKSVPSVASSLSMRRWRPGEICPTFWNASNPRSAYALVRHPSAHASVYLPNRLSSLGSSMSLSLPGMSLSHWYRSGSPWSASYVSWVLI